MNEKTGVITVNPSQDELQKKRLVPLTPSENEILQKLPEMARPMALAEMRYVDERAKYGRKVHSNIEKNAFRVGFMRGRESMKPEQDIPQFQFYPEDFNGLVWGITSPEQGMKIICQRANEVLARKRWGEP